MIFLVITCVVLISSSGIASSEGENEETSFQIDLCVLKTCRNDGNCKMVGETAKCECKKPYFGDDCNEVDEETTTASTVEPEEETEPPIDLCSSNPCENGGICREGNSSWKCDCIYPYSGEDCSKVIEETHTTTIGTTAMATTIEQTTKKEDELDYCYGTPCGDHGKCRIEGDGFKCYCEPLYTGDACDEESTEPPVLSTTLEPDIPNSTLSTTPETRSTITREDTTIESNSPTTSEDTTRVPNSSTTSEDTTRVPNSPTTPGDTTVAVSNSPTTSVDTTKTKSPTTSRDTTIETKSPTTSRDTTIETKSPTTSRDTTIEFISTTTSEVTPIDHDSCISNPCLNNGSCIRMESSVRCNCTYPFSGEFCDTDLLEKIQSSSNSIVYACTGSVVAIFIVFLIGFSVLWRLKRAKLKKRESYFHNADLSSMESENSRTYII